MKQILRLVMVDLWTINRILRWTGWRLIVSPADDDNPTTRIGFAYWGWEFLRNKDIR